MKQHITATRAVGALYAARLIRPFAATAFVVFILMAGLVLYLTLNVSGWWAIFFLPLLVSAFILFQIWVLLQATLRKVAPNLTKEQKRAVRSFIDKVAAVADSVKTPPHVILYRVIKDTLFYKEQRFLLEMTNNSTSLKRDFDALSKLF